VSGLSVALLGLAVLAGWCTANPLLIQIHPVFAAMHYNSALGLLVCGAGLAALAFDRRRLGVGCAGAIFLFSLGTLLELGGRFDLGLHGWWITPGSSFTYSVPGRVEPCAILCFLLAGGALLLLSWPAGRARQSMAAGALGLALLCLGSLAFCGYFSGFTSVAGRAPATRMAMQEALGFVVVGIGVLAFACCQAGFRQQVVGRWLPMAACGAALTATLLLWQALTVQDHRRIERMVHFEASHVQSELQDSTRGQFGGLVHLAHEWYGKGRPSPQEGARAAGSYMGDHPGCLGVAWIAADGQLDWLETLGEVRKLEKGTFGNAERQAGFVYNLREQRELTVARAPGAWQGGARCLVVCMPSLSGPQGEGGLLAVFRLHQLLDSVLSANVAPGYAVTIRDGEEQIYSRNAAEQDYRTDWGCADQVKCLGMDWQVQTWPTLDVMARERFSLGKVALVVGILLAALLALAVHLALTARRRAQELETEIAERRQAENALRHSEAKYRSLIENLEQSVLLKDHNLVYVAANKHFCQSVGCAEAEVVGKTDMDFFPPAVAERYRVDDRQVLEEGTRLEREEPLPQPSGSPRTLRLIRTPVKDGQGQTSGVLEIIWDVTEQRALEAQLRQAQKMEAIGQLAGGIAHDFNNLLTAILGNVSLVTSSLAGRDPNRELIEAAEKATLRAAALTRQLLGFSRQAPLHSQPADLRQTINEVVNLLSRTIDPRIELQVKGASDLWPVQADSGQMNQVLMNLCINARDAMPHGGVLQVECENTVLGENDVRLHLDARAGEFIRLSVRDTGNGIPPEIRSRIFEPFFTTKGPGKGTGLGLAMVFGIIQQHGGWISCHSTVGQGTRFDIFLPRCVPTAVPAASADASPSIRQGTETILLVDDEPMIRNLGQMILERYGHQVLLAEDGLNALEVYRAEGERIDLVILDLTMPHLSGQDTLRRLLQINPRVKVLFASGYTAETLTHSEQGTVLGFVSKPFRPEGLAEAVRTALDRRPAGIAQEEGSACTV
jgi:PAS domain S-box-containing protein